MSAELVEKALISSLGYLPEIQSIEEDQGLFIGVAHTPDGETLDEPGTHIGFVVDPPNLTMLIRISDNDANIVHPIGGPDSMTLRLAVNIVDEREWSGVRDGGGLQAMSLLFGGHPDPQSVLAWDDSRIDQTGTTALVELQTQARRRRWPASDPASGRGAGDRARAHARSQGFRGSRRSASEAPCGHIHRPRQSPERIADDRL